MDENTAKDLILLSEKDNQILLLERKLSQLEPIQAKLSADLAIEQQKLAELKEKQANLEKDISIADKILTKETEKKKKTDDRLMNVNNEKEYKAFKKELQIIHNVILKQENLLLTYEEEKETLLAEVEDKQALYDFKAADVEKKISEIAEQTKEMNATILVLKEETKTLQEKLPAEIKSIYNRLMAHKVIPVAIEIEDAFCKACGNQLPANQFNELIKKQTISCNNCKRFLFYKEPPTT